MMNRLLPVVALLSLSAIPRPTSGQIAKQHPRVQSNVALLDAWIESELAYGGMPGLAIAIVHDQEVVFSKAYGFANTKAQREMTTATAFRLASHSKLLAALAIMQLRDDGKLRLDDPVETQLSS
jgi:CubicO group peptidase (beta-lactamase class C family)